MAPVDLAIAQAASAPAVTVGEALTYTLTVANQGLAPVSGVVLTDPIPAGVVLGSPIASQGTCSGTAPVSCALGGLAVGASATVQLAVTPTTVGTLVNTARSRWASPTAPRATTPPPRR